MLLAVKYIPQHVTIPTPATGCGQLPPQWITRETHRTHRKVSVNQNIEAIPFIVTRICTRLGSTDSPMGGRDFADRS